MTKSTLLINVVANGAIGRIDIIGSISEWNQNNASDMRGKCQELKNGGATSAHVYLMTVGGDCFQANEIVNILKEVFGSYTAEGGALVASAGTYIGVNADSFTMAKNGQYMIHKPSGYVGGNETDVENYLQLLKNMTAVYFDAYKAKLKKPEEEFKAKWDGGDFWLTAQSAFEWGFVTDVKEPVKIDKATATAIKESGSPIAILPTDIINHNDEKDMDLKAVAKSLGLPESATEEQINAKMADNASKAAELDTLKATMAQKEKEERAAKIKAKLDDGERNKLFKADARKVWQEKLEADFDGTSALMDTLQPVAKGLSAEIKSSADGTGATYQGKTFEQLQDSDPEALAELEDSNPEAYAALFADWKKRNKIK